MRFLPPDDEVTLYEQGFDTDLLGREKAGKVLSELLERIEDPLVIALDGQWGTGKTHFLKRWVGAHQTQNGGTATTVYFDAFANDYIGDPLIALVGALGSRLPGGKRSKLKDVQKAAFKLVKPLARIGLAAVSFGASEAVNDLGDEVVEAVKGEAVKALDEFWQREEGRRAAMEQFRAAITSLVAPEKDLDSTSSSLVIVIDELDRCRPDYALEVLEIIKHFFSVPRVHFILGVNMEALENSVKARYGHGIDATAYLKKFISLTLSLPDTIGDQEGTTAVVAYTRHTAEAMGISRPIADALLEHLKIVSRVNHISIRDVGKILSTLTLLPERATRPNQPYGWREVIITLVVSKFIRPDLYSKFLHCTVREEDIASYYGTTKEERTSSINHRNNPRYNHPAAIRHATWSYLRNNGRFEEDS